MKTLTLFRHGKSSWDNPDLTDRQRPLNKRGKREVPAMATRFNALGIRPSLIMASPAERAWSTAKLLADGLGYPREFMHRENHLYLADVSQLIDGLTELDDSFNNVVICGHNPGLTDFAQKLVPGVTDNIPTSGFVVVKSQARTWKEFVAKPVELIACDYPARYRDSN